MNDASKLKINNSNYDIEDAVARNKIDNAALSTHCTCNTAADVAKKVVVIANTNWQLKIGTIIGVKFTYSNSASNVTLNVNNTGDIGIYYGNAVYTGNATNVCGLAGRTIYL